MSKITFDQIGVMSVQYQQYSFKYCLKSLKECGIKNLDFWGGLPHYYRMSYPYTIDADKKKEALCAHIESNGLKVVVYTPETLAYPYSFTDPDEWVRKSTVNFFNEAMDDALKMGTNKLFLNSGYGLRDLPIEESWERLIDSYKQIARIAEEKGIVLVLEQLQPYESNLVTDMKTLNRVLEEVNSKSLYICIDIVAMAVAGEKLESYFELFGDRVQLIHFSDTNHYILGDGDLPLKHYIEVMEKYDYKGIVDLEINDSIYWKNPHNSILRSVKWLHDNLR